MQAILPGNSVCVSHVKNVLLEVKVTTHAQSILKGYTWRKFRIWSIEVFVQLLQAVLVFTLCLNICPRIHFAYSQHVLLFYLYPKHQSLEAFFFVIIQTHFPSFIQHPCSRKKSICVYVWAYVSVYVYAYESICSYIYHHRMKRTRLFKSTLDQASLPWKRK